MGLAHSAVVIWTGGCSDRPTTEVDEPTDTDAKVNSLKNESYQAQRHSLHARRNEDSILQNLPQCSRLLNPIALFRICSFMTTQTTHLPRLLEREPLTSRLGCVRLPA